MSATETVGTWRPAWGLPPPLPSGPRRGCLAQNGTADGRGPHEASPPNPLNEAECGGCGWCQTWLSAPPCPHATLLSRHLSPGAVQRPTRRPQMAERGRRRQRGPCRGSGAPRQGHNLGSPVTGSSHVPAAKGGRGATGEGEALAVARRQCHTVGPAHTASRQPGAGPPEDGHWSSVALGCGDLWGAETRAESGVAGM